MKKIILGLIASLILLPAISFAQTTAPQAPASWTAFMQQENAKRAAFYKQMKADRDTFISANPDVKTYLGQMHAYSQARMAAWRAAHPLKHPLNRALATSPAGQ